MSKLGIAIIGAGHLGKIHARLAKSSEQWDVIGVVDPLPASRTAVATELKLPTFEDFRELIGKIDAAIVATPTLYHYEVASTLLRSGVHVLVEKPLASTPDQAARLVQIAKRHSLTLQVGHVERFNPSWTAVQSHLGSPKYIDCVRAGAYSGRSTDIGVVHDLMIHDIDLVLSLVRSPVASVSACGLALLGEREDLAEARVHFENGCIANFKASRLGLEASRRMSVYTSSSMAEIDFGNNTVRLIKPSDEVLEREVQLDHLTPDARAEAKANIFGKYFTIENLPAQPRNAILDEQNDFALSIRTKTAPSVTGEDGQYALELAGRVLDQIQSHGWEGASSRPWQIGPSATPSPKIIPIPKPSDTRRWGKTA